VKNFGIRHTGAKNLRNYQHSYNGYSGSTFQSRVEGADSVVGTASRYCLDVSGVEPRLGQNFLLSTPVKTDPEFHPSSCTMGNRVYSRRQSVRDLALINHFPIECQGQTMCKAIHPRPLYARTEYYRDTMRLSNNCSRSCIVELLRECFRSRNQQRKNTTIEATRSYYSGSEAR